MAATASKTFVVERSDQQKVEVTAERAEQDPNSSRVSFFNGEECVGSFINTAAWYQKPAE